MTLIEYLESLKNIQHLEVEENFVRFQAKFELAPVQDEVIVNLLNSLENISNRDSFELDVDSDGDRHISTACSIGELTLLTEYLEENKDESRRKVLLSIRKSTSESILSVYSLNTFSEYLVGENKYNCLALFSENFNDVLEFQVFSDIQSFGSKTIKFLSYLDGAGSSTVIERREKILFQSDQNSHKRIDACSLLPEDFHLEERSGLKSIDRVFDELCAYLCVEFLSNSSVLEKNGNFQFKINGYKSISGDNSLLGSLVSQLNKLYQIYQWSYSHGQAADKLGLVRNMLSINLDIDRNLVIDQDLWHAIQSNYQIYLQGNIQSYLEVKSKINEYLMEASTKILAIGDQFLESLKNQVSVLIGFFLTVVVVNSFKDLGVSGFFSAEYLFVVLLLAVMSFVWLALQKKEINSRYERVSDIYSEILKHSYKSVLLEKEIEQSLDTVFKNGKEGFDRTVLKYSKWWKVSILVFVALYVLFALIITCVNNLNVVSDSEDSNKASFHHTNISSNPNPLIEIEVRSISDTGSPVIEESSTSLEEQTEEGVDTEFTTD